jgi:hypothetical protein
MASYREVYEMYFNTRVSTVGLMSIGLSLLSAWAGLSAFAAEATAPVLRVTAYPQGDALFYRSMMLDVAAGKQEIRIPVIENANDIQVLPKSESWPGGVTPLGLFDTPANSQGLEAWVNHAVWVKDDVSEKYVKGTLKALQPRYNMALVDVSGQVWRVTTDKVLVRDVPQAMLNTLYPASTLKLSSVNAARIPVDVFFEAPGLNAQMVYTWRLPNPSTTPGALLEATLRVNNMSETPLEGVQFNALFGANRQPNYRPYAMKAMRAMPQAAEASMGDVAGPAQAESVGELMMLRLPGAFSLKPMQSATLPYKSFTFGKEAVQRYVYAPTQYGWWWNSGNDRYAAPNYPVQHWLEISQWPEELPEGTFRAYQPDTQGGVQLIGEGQQPYHAPRQPLRIQLGEAPQIRAIKAQTAYQYSEATKITTLSYEVKVTNTKPAPVSIDVYEYPDADYKLVKHNGTPLNVEGVPLAFRIPLAGNETKTLTYTLTRKG